MERAIDLGAEDVEINEDGSIEVITPPNDFLTIKEAFEKDNLKFEMAELTMKADNEVELAGDEGIKMQKILDVLDDLDDVQEVYTNAVIEN
jgi:transcriptional/translational regulatory protein YebC/TACO1